MSKENRALGEFSNDDNTSLFCENCVGDNLKLFIIDKVKNLREFNNINFKKLKLKKLICFGLLRLKLIFRMVK